jgi:heparan-alpha-glucosaminide N-acetyltransferase
MSTTLIDLAEEQRAPLLNDDDIVPASSSNGPDASSPSPTTDPSQRLASLDVFRGLTVAVRTRPNSSYPHLPVPFLNFQNSPLIFLYICLIQLMILVDDAGGAIPSINHSPWFGVTLADFVMPFFLFGVGVSISLAFKVFCNR